RSLLHLRTWADRRRCFERVAASLRSDGRFAWNAFAFDHHVASAIDGQHADTPLPHMNYYSVSDNRVDITLEGGGTGCLWWATKNEWLGLLDVAGLRLEALYGGFAGEPLDDDSREYIFVARRERPACPSRQRQATFPNAGAGWRLRGPRTTAVVVLTPTPRLNAQATFPHARHPVEESDLR